MTSILWDMGGTLFDTYPYVDSAFQRVTADGGHEVAADEIGKLTRVSRTHAIDELSRRTGIPVAAFEDSYELVKKGWVSDPAPLMDGAEELVQACRHGRGKNIIVTHRDRDSAEQLVASANVTFDDIISTSDGYPRKPDPAMIIAALERNSLLPEDCIAIGDREIDCEAALAAGVTPVLLVSDAVTGTESEYRTVKRLVELLPLFSLDVQTPANPWSERG
ncbi:HAD-IA family hydrolase [Flaviflexus huanghaiensis]|uniref:HAD-IA family hydrolase n=1 Tax=Flaviflexus huanghaiensis TaxID=1111473 RepID=UPI0015FBEE18|nr:HAD-IA family hydrolase [Flaviflexus huanghaiensis]